METTPSINKYLWVWIDPTRACNLSCKLCYTKDLHSQNHMPLETFSLIIDSLVNENIILQKLHLNWNGEPTLNPNLIDFARILESKPVYFPWEFHTNGMAIDYEYAIKMISTVKTGNIYVSIDGGNAFSHNFNRGVGTFEKSLIGLANLIRAKKELGFGPKVGVFQLDLGVPDKEYSSDFLKVLEGVDEWVRVKPFHPKNGAQFDVNVLKLHDYKPNWGIDTNKLPSNRWWLYQVPDPSFLPSRPCFWAGNALFFHTNGDARVCLFSREAGGHVGNIHTNPIQDIIKKAEAFREQINLSGRQNCTHCKGCKFLEGEPRIEVEQNQYQAML